MSSAHETQAATDAKLTADIRFSTRDEPVSARLSLNPPIGLW